MASGTAVTPFLRAKPFPKLFPPSTRTQYRLYNSTVMGLVGYSDSEGSDDEAAPNVSGTKPKKEPPSKRNFQKVVDRVNPNKIKVNLQDAPVERPADAEDGPPSKKKKVGGGLMGGFNAMLPAPKRTGISAAGSAGSRSGLGKGVSLRTGAAPGFTRDPMESSTTNSDELEGSNGAEGEKAGDESSVQPNTTSASETPAEPALKGKVTMFKPLSVARKPQKPKKKVDAVSKENSAPKPDAVPPSSSTTATNAKPKVSLFSSYAEDDRPAPSTNSNGDYQPMLYQSHSNDVPEAAAEIPDYAQQSQGGSHPAQASTGAQSLDAIAQDLNLSAAHKRQLFGRSGKGAGAKITTFDMDAEYTANEELRANQDLQEVRNPVRAIQPGKHSLRQLVNAAVGQKEALEEHFASGRQNKKEAGSRYGW